eukprot:GDKI01044561.1.p1 GENE.GDKI01044561.1~~GDKI01044561.1.p1  ORF type:complete len:440 (+),score=102.80 GDKI01044561.1:84-1322(+)
MRSFIVGLLWCLVISCFLSLSPLPVAAYSSGPPSCAQEPQAPPHDNDGTFTGDKITLSVREKTKGGMKVVIDGPMGTEVRGVSVTASHGSMGHPDETNFKSQCASTQVVHKNGDAKALPLVFDWTNTWELDDDVSFDWVLVRELTAWKRFDPVRISLTEPTATTSQTDTTPATTHQDDSSHQESEDPQHTDSQQHQQQSGRSESEHVDSSLSESEGSETESEMEQHKGGGGEREKPTDGSLTVTTTSTQSVISVTESATGTVWLSENFQPSATPETAGGVETAATGKDTGAVNGNETAGASAMTETDESGSLWGIQTDGGQDETATNGNETAGDGNETAAEGEVINDPSLYDGGETVRPHAHETAADQSAGGESAASETAEHVGEKSRGVATASRVSGVAMGMVCVCAVLFT